MKPWELRATCTNPSFRLTCVAIYSVKENILDRNVPEFKDVINDTRDIGDKTK